MDSTMHSKAKKCATYAVTGLLTATMAVAFIPVAPHAVTQAEAATPTITVTKASTGKLTMKNGASYKLAAKASSGKLTYTSSKPKVVAVSKAGKLTAKKTGSAKITLKVKGTKVSSKVSVKVVKPAKFKAVKKIKSLSASTTLKVGKTTTVKAKFNPASPSNKNLTFKSSNASVAKVDAKGKVTAVKAGTATITATSCDNAKAKKSVKITVEEEAAPVDPKNSGVIDTSKAARGQESLLAEGQTPEDLLNEAINYNQITTDESERSTAVNISETTATYLKTTDYGKDVDLKVELLTPSTAKAGKTPLVVWINGGGFTRSDPGEGLDTRLALAKAGFVVASVQHRVSVSHGTFPAPLQDIKAAIRYLKANNTTYKFDKNKVAVGGNSSGGYYATMIGVTGNLDSIVFGTNRDGTPKTCQLDVGDNLDESSSVNAVIDFYGVSDLTIIGSGLDEALEKSHHSAATTEALLLNGAAAATKGVGVFDETMVDKVATASPFTYIDESDPNFYIVHGTEDTLVSPVSSKMLQNRLEAANVNATRVVIDGARHGGSAFIQDSVMNGVIEFLNENATQDIVEPENVADPTKGSKAYEAEDLPTLAQATEGAIEVAIDPDKYSISQVKDVTYKTVKTSGTYTTLKMHILVPQAADKSPRPVLYQAACGGFNKSNPNAMSYLRYAEKGYVVAVAEIRVVPTVTMPAPIQDGKAGIRWLRAHADTYNIDKDCFIVIGGSAGGYFAAMLGVLSNTTKYDDEIQFDVGDNLDESSAVQGVIDQWGVSDLTIIGAGLSNYDVHDSESNTEALLINGTAFGTNPGGSIFSDFDKAAKFSPFTYVDKDDPSFLFFHGTADMSVSPVATMELYKRCKAAGLDAERYSFVGAGHGGWQMSTDKALALIDDYMAKVVASCK